MFIETHTGSEHRLHLPFLGTLNIHKDALLHIVHLVNIQYMAGVAQGLRVNPAYFEHKTSFRKALTGITNTTEEKARMEGTLLVQVFQSTPTRPICDPPKELVPLVP